MVKIVRIFWRDIPAQVIVQRGRERAKGALSSRFQEAIDRAAMRAGKGSSNAYLSEWRRATAMIESDDDLSRLLQIEIECIESNYSNDRIAKLIRANGTDEV